MTYAVWHGLAAYESSSDLVVLASPSVTVTDRSDGSQPNVYEDRDGNTALGNPFTANADGSITFYVEPGRYKIEATKGGNTATWDDVQIGTLPGLDTPAQDDLAYYDAANTRWAKLTVGEGDTLARESGGNLGGKSASTMRSILSVYSQAETYSQAEVRSLVVNDVHPETATDGGTDAYDSETTTATPDAGDTILRYFQSTNTTASPTLDTVSLVDVAGNAWAGMIEARVHWLLFGVTNYVVLDPGGSIRSISTTDTLTEHLGNGVAVSASSDQTIFDIASAARLHGGMIYGPLPVNLRLTIDGTEATIYSANDSTGNDFGGDFFSTIWVPPNYSNSSMKLVFANGLASSQNYGWKVLTS